MLMAALSAKIREYVKSDLGPLQKWKHVQDLLVSNNVAYRTLAKASAFAVHEKNRSGTLINPYSMHSKGLQIIQTGADVHYYGKPKPLEGNPKQSLAKRDGNLNF